MYAFVTSARGKASSHICCRGGLHENEVKGAAQEKGKFKFGMKETISFAYAFCRDKPILGRQIVPGGFITVEIGEHIVDLFIVYGLAEIR